MKKLWNKTKSFGLYRVIGLLSLFHCLFLLTNCKQERSYPQLEEHIGQSILDIEYINDTLDLNLVDFRMSNLSNKDRKLEIFMITERTDEFSRDHSYFVHMYPKKESEDEGNYIALGTNSVEVSDELIVYSREFNIEENYFDFIRYGMLDGDGKRLFTLTLDSVQLK